MKKCFVNKKRVFTIVIVALVVIAYFTSIVQALATEHSMAMDVKLKESNSSSIVIEVVISGNEGYSSLQYGLKYNSEIFTLTNVEIGGTIPENDRGIIESYFKESENADYKNPCMFLYRGASNSGQVQQGLDECNSNNGVLATYTFDYESKDEDGYYDFSLEKVAAYYLESNSNRSINCTSKKLTILLDKELDIDNSGIIDEYDVEELRKGINLKVNEANERFDLNGDGFINESDVEEIRNKMPY